MRSLLAVIFGVALLIQGSGSSVALGDPADAASLTPAEQKFVDHYSPYYPKGTSPQQVLSLAEATCSLLTEGYPLKTIADQVNLIIPELTNEEAAKAVGWPAGAECPEMTARFRR